MTKFMKLVDMKFKVGEKIDIKHISTGVVRACNGSSNGNIYVIEYNDGHLMAWEEGSIDAIVKTYEFGGVTFEDTGVDEDTQRGRWYLGPGLQIGCFCAAEDRVPGMRRLLKRVEGCQCK